MRFDLFTVGARDSSFVQHLQMSFGLPSSKIDVPQLQTPSCLKA